MLKTLREKIYKIPDGSGAVKVPELLSPAGTPECARAAVLNGADAVYLGLKEGSARAGAGNFTPEELRETAGFAHARNAAVYVAVNTLAFGDAELLRYLELAKKAVLSGADAIIVQDAGLLRLMAKERSEGRFCGDFGIHVSTQAGMCTPGALRFAKRAGAERVILPRELTLSEIETLAREAEGLGMQLETFVHGAVCICFSGQCLMSSFSGGRSGNRGECAQPCRLNYSTDGRKYAHLLSPDDLCTLPLLDKICAAGVSSLKIEGRLKSPEYTALATRAYRTALDAVARGEFGSYKENEMPEALDELRSVFTRNGGSTGFYEGNPGRARMTFDNAGRKGLFLGNAASAERQPGNAKNGLNFFTVNGFDSTGLRPGDGVTIIRQNGETAGGGTVNKTSPSLLVCGELKAKYISDPAVYLTYDSELMKAAAQTYAEGAQTVKIPIKTVFSARPGERAELTLSDRRGRSYTVYSARPLEEALSSPANAQDVSERLSKLSSTPFYAYEQEIHIDGNVFLSVAELNGMRREAAENLEKILRSEKVYRGPRKDNAVFPASVKVCQAPALPAYSIYYYSVERFLADAENGFADTAKKLKTGGAAPFVCYLPFTCWEEPDIVRKLPEITHRYGTVIAAAMPFLPLPEQNRRLSALSDTIIDRSGGVLVTHPGQFELFAGIRLPDNFIIAGDSSLNISNSEAVRAYTLSGAILLTLSPEISTGAAEEILKNRPSGVLLEQISGGGFPVMRLRHCLIGTMAPGCGACSKKSTDGRPATFPLYSGGSGEYIVLPLPDDSPDPPPRGRFCENVILSPGASARADAMPGEFIQRYYVI